MTMTPWTPALPGYEEFDVMRDTPMVSSSEIYGSR